MDGTASISRAPRDRIAVALSWDGQEDTAP